MAEKPVKSSAQSEEDLVLDNIRVNHRTPRFVYVVTLLSAVGGFLFGYDTGVISGAMILLRDQFDLSPVWQELVVSVTIGAAWLFALIGGFLTDALGRKPVILLASFIFTAGSILLGLAINKSMLLIGRVIVGAGIGFVSVTVPMYIAEISVETQRGVLTTVYQWFITAGLLVSCIVDGIFSYNLVNGWRYMLGLAAVPAFLQFCGFLVMPESPRWLISKGQYDRALTVLRSTRHPNANIEEEYDSIKFSYLETEREREARGTSTPIIVQVLSHGPLMRALLIGCSLQMFQQIAGINTVMYYSATIIEMSGIGNKSKVIWLAAATASVNFLCTFIGVYLVEKIGRRKLLLASMLGVFFSLIVLAVGFQLAAANSPAINVKDIASTCSAYMNCNSCISSKNCGFCQYSGNFSSCLPITNDVTSHSMEGHCNSTSLPSDTLWAYNWCPSHYSWLMLLGMVLYLFFFAPGFGPMPWTINSEIYPLWARSTCYSVATSINWAFNLLVSMTFLSLTEAITKYGTFWLYSGLTFVGLIVFYLFLPETKGRTLEEVEQLFSRPWITSPPAEDNRMIQYVHIRGLNRDCSVDDADSADES
ncbi:SLC2A13 (predicted) [Pycnogonum litorale]